MSIEIEFVKGIWNFLDMFLPQSMYNGLPKNIHKFSVVRSSLYWGEKDVRKVLLYTIKNVCTAAVAWERQQFCCRAKTIYSLYSIQEGSWNKLWACPDWRNIIDYTGWAIKNWSVCNSASDCLVGMEFCVWHAGWFYVIGASLSVIPKNSNPSFMTSESACMYVLTISFG